MKTPFETEACGRCGGSGKYSYCSMAGDRCFGCGGSGIRFSKRGHAANAYCTALRSKRADQVVVGDEYRSEGFSCGSFSQPTQWVKVLSIGPDPLNAGMILIEGDKQTYGVFPSSMLRIRQTAERSAATVAEALAYQATLTKTGKPRATRKAVAA